MTSLHFSHLFSLAKLLPAPRLLGHRAVILIVSMMLVGCGSTTTPEPAGIGRAIDDLKRSPCACLEIEQDYSDWGAAPA